MENYTLITGATKGIGFELARQFGKDGNNIVLVARNRLRLQNKSQRLEKEYGIKTKMISKDLSKPTSPKELYREIENRD